MSPTILNNRYHVVRELGDGGFGKTYLVEDTQMPSHRLCVVKQLKPITDKPQVYELVKARFGREAAVLEELGRGSRQIPELYAYFSQEGQFYLVQEYIAGETLTAKVQREGPLREIIVRQILKDILPVLEYIHSKGLVHRDVKPDNIILRASDGLPVLIDFGAVREAMSTVLNSQGNATHSIVIGSPGFMSSEQAIGRPVYSSDLYSLGLTAIYLLTGKLPQELATNYKDGEVIWQPYAPNVSPGLAAVLNQAIKVQPGERFSSAGEMLAALLSPYVTPTPEASAHSFSQLEPPPTVISSNRNSGQLGGGGTFNTSVSIPPEIRGWNWGAFLLSGIWCVNNQVWIGLLTWIPYLGLPIPFILGAKGNVWAWKSRHWRSVQDFKANQRAWAKAGVIVYSSISALAFLAVLLATMVGNKNPATDNSTPAPIASGDATSPYPSANNPSSGYFKQVRIGSLVSYAYGNGVFSMSVPQDWTFTDKTDPRRLYVQWLDPTGNGLIYVRMIKADGNLTIQELGTQLQDFLSSAYKSESDFQMSMPAAQPDNTAKIDWSLTAAGDNGVKGTLQGRSYILQVGDKVAIVSFIAPQAQYSDLEPAFAQIFNSFQIERQTPLP